PVLRRYPRHSGSAVEPSLSTGAGDPALAGGRARAGDGRRAARQPRAPAALQPVPRSPERAAAPLAPGAARGPLLAPERGDRVPDGAPDRWRVRRDCRRQVVGGRRAAPAQSRGPLQGPGEGICTPEPGAPDLATSRGAAGEAAWPSFRSHAYSNDPGGIARNGAARPGLRRRKSAQPAAPSRNRSVRL